MPVLYSLNYYSFKDIEVTHDEVDRDRIVSIFYEKSEKVLELEFDEFDINLIREEKEKRGGKRQAYFNPKEEYQEALEESAIRLAQHADKASIKAKQGENLKKTLLLAQCLRHQEDPLKLFIPIKTCNILSLV